MLRCNGEYIRPLTMWVLWWVLSASADRNPVRLGTTPDNSCGHPSAAAFGHIGFQPVALKEDWTWIGVTTDQRYYFALSGPGHITG